MAKPNLFNSVKVTKPKKNVFDLTHDVKMSMKMGQLTPVLVQECVPGDSFQIGCDSLIRFAPLLAPVMHKIDVSVHYFFVPNRIVWDNWEKFIVDANTQHVLPYMPYDSSYYQNLGASQLRLLDYLGIPPVPSTGATQTNINALPIAAYRAIYNEYYRDQNLIPQIDYKLNDGDATAGMSWNDIANFIKIHNRAWEHDYFTSSLPFAQKGAAVDIPLGEINGNAEVKFNNILGTTLTGNPYSPVVDPGVGGSGVGVDQLFAETDGLDISPTTINDLRRAFRLQEWLEKNARGGTRYIENILMHFGVKSSDARLQRPEYITGVKTPVIISEVLNTAGTFEAGNPDDPTSPVTGSMAGHGVAVSTGKYGNYFCEEHGYIIGIMSVMPKTAYQQGIPKTYLKNDPLDFFWPSFAHIGEQPVINAELYAYTATANETFGYVPRYAEYKFNPSRVAGDFRTSLDYWHLGRKFATQPALNQTFIECTPAQVNRIFSVTDENQDTLYCQILHKIRAIRPMPKFGTPMF
jgi:hypothetical protein